MFMTRKFAVIAASALIAGGLLTGAAFASAPASTEKLDQAVAEGKLTQGAADLLKQIHELRQAAMERFKGDRQALIDQAVAAGTITQEEAEQLQAHPLHKGMRFKGGPGPMRMSAEEFEARLAERVAAGYMTQEQADQILSGKAMIGGMKMKRGGFGHGGFMLKEKPARAN